VKRLLSTLMVAVTLSSGALPATAATDPEADLQAFRNHYQQRFPGVELADYQDGIYAINADARSGWQQIMAFPPYEDALKRGEALFNTPFTNGRRYADCFENGGIAIRQNYPYWDRETQQVKTLEQEINECRIVNEEPVLPYKHGDIAAISAYMASTSNGLPINIIIPADQPAALAAYERGRDYFFAKRGQLNLSCANCHIDSPGLMLRAEMLGPALGHPTHFPAYRLKWGELGTLHRRYSGCTQQVRARAAEPQSDTYRELEYFHTYMSNGIPINAPGLRK